MQDQNAEARTPGGWLRFVIIRQLRHDNVCGYSAAEFNQSISAFISGTRTHEFKLCGNVQYELRERCALFVFDVTRSITDCAQSTICTSIMRRNNHRHNKTSVTVNTAEM